MAQHCEGQRTLFALQGFHPPPYLTSDLSSLKQIPCRGIASHFLFSILPMYYQTCILEDERIL